MYVILAHPWGHLGIHGGPKMAQTAPKPPKRAQNQQKWRKCPYKAQNGSDGPKTVFRDIIHDCMSYWPTHGAIWGSTGAPKWPKQHQNGLKWPKIYRGGQNGPTRPKMVLVALKQFSETYYMIICYIGPPKRVHNSTKMSLNCTKLIKMAHNDPS